MKFILVLALAICVFGQFFGGVPAQQNNWWAQWQNAAQASNWQSNLANTLNSEVVQINKTGTTDALGYMTPWGFIQAPASR